jgi:hypothetical protein
MRPAVTAGLSAARRIISLGFIPHGFMLSGFMVGFMCLSGLLGPQSAIAAPPANVDSQRLVDADKDPGNWLSYGRTYSEQRFSPLTRINATKANTSWVPGDYYWDGNDWQWAGGYWLDQPWTEAIWIPGHWSDRFWGWTWVPGYWG